MVMLPLGAAIAQIVWAPLGLTGERYISHWATRFGEDLNLGRQHWRPKMGRLNQLCHSAPPVKA